MSSTNLEEAATVAAEYIYSLENLPAEVQFLLSEMKVKDTRAQELHSEIQKEGAKYVRHSLRAPPGQQLTAKDVSIPSIVSAQYAEIDQLSFEKEQLAQRVVQLVARAQARLDRDLGKMLALQGEPPVDPTPAYYYYGASRNPVAQLNESLRSAIAIPETPSTPVSSTVQAGPPQKSKLGASRVIRLNQLSPAERRLGGTASAGSIKLPSPAPATVPPATGTGAAGQRSRLGQQVMTGRGRRATASVGPEADEDAEGEDDVEDEAMEENGDQEDEQVYCFCQKLSYGEMVGCDNEDCRYQWFHLNCVNLKPPLPDQWYCPECAPKFANGGSAGPERRKGRKRQ
ncbi:uncharacterized protein PHACADRAFT_163954 [Phanerochaete carnosa HHB-10118-sp]|uniref:Chromatin modification-related protein n=1 Tax=Phanerochaete carnosa (strain HHB-10118-sp) TaxID=650164 RepID=K5W3D2_PHACS|nr:uncharacterized protein PHACADRAFT_163954 [Phanerochaete carnosa HHB-10118-sp]EKM53645.1 hypothetical protein PHACADRAFT_163954 [Phanerochaete carnosa HHB-10118-sp]